MTGGKIAAAIIAISLALAGCAAQENPYPDDTASALQAQVMQVTESAASGDPVSALARLDEFIASVKDALARGTITQERHDSIIASADLVRADLERAIVVLQEEQTDDPDPGNSHKPDKPDKEDEEDDD